MREKRRYRSVYFTTKELAERFQQLYYDYMPLFELPYSGNNIGGVYHNPYGYHSGYYWFCGFQCTSEQWADIKKKLKLKRVITYFSFYEENIRKNWVFKEAK